MLQTVTFSGRSSHSVHGIAPASTFWTAVTSPMHDSCMRGTTVTHCQVIYGLSCRTLHYQKRAWAMKLIRHRACGTNLPHKWRPLCVFWGWRWGSYSGSLQSVLFPRGRESWYQLGDGYHSICDGDGYLRSREGIGGVGVSDWRTGWLMDTGTMEKVQRERAEETGKCTIILLTTPPCIRIMPHKSSILYACADNEAAIHGARCAAGLWVRQNNIYCR